MRPEHAVILGHSLVESSKIELRVPMSQHVDAPIAVTEHQRTRLTEEDVRNIELATFLLRLEEANEKGDDLLTKCFWVLACPHQEKDGHGHPPGPGVDILFASKLDPPPPRF